MLLELALLPGGLRCGRRRQRRHRAALHAAGSAPIPRGGPSGSLPSCRAAMLVLDLKRREGRLVGLPLERDPICDSSFSSVGMMVLQEGGQIGRAAFGKGPHM